MSTVETKTPKTIKLTKKYEGYNENLELISVEKEIEFTEVVDNEKALEVLNSTNGYIDAANYLVRRNALSEARKAAGLSGGISREVLMEFIKPYRELPNFAAMIKSEDKRKASAEEWNAQTQAILDQIKNVPFIMQSIKDRSAAESEAE